MLFHYSDDIVRAPIHNTRTLIDEYLSNEIKMQKNEVGSYQLEQILDELSHSILHDKILLENLGEEFISAISDSIKKDKKPTVIYLKNKTPQKTYYNWCVDYLNTHIFEPNHKKEIEFAIRTWIVEVVSYGYSPEYIYNYIHLMLMRQKTNPQKIFSNFLNQFSFSKDDFRVYFTFSSTIATYKTLLEERLDLVFQDDGNFERVKTRKNDFIGYVDIQSLDRYNAVYEASDYIDTFIRYYKVISNRKNQLVRKFALVNRKQDTSFYSIPIKSFGYRSYEPKPKDDLHETIDSIIINCQNKPQITYTQLNKIINLHNEAIDQQDLNDGFLNLWSILEVITSKINRESKIDKVIFGITPILKKDYFTVTFENIDQDLSDNLSKKDYDNLVKVTSPNGKTRNYLSRFIFSPEYEDLREEYFEKLAKFPVIRMKIYRLWELSGSKKQLLKLSREYEQRVTWHIYRLYRTRNAIVHSGESHLRIQALGEHLHIYVDRIIAELLVKLASEPTLQSISDVLIDTTFSLSTTEKLFSEETPITDDDLPLLGKAFFYRSDN